MTLTCEHSTGGRALWPSLVTIRRVGERCGRHTRLPRGEQSENISPQHPAPGRGARDPGHKVRSVMKVSNRITALRRLEGRTCEFPG